MTEEVQESLPIEPPQPADAPADAPADPSTVEVQSEQQPEPQPEEPKKQPWFLQRISEESSKARQAAERAEAAERRAREAEELLKRFNQTAPDDRERRPAPSAAQPFEDGNRQDEIRREAQRLRFQDDINDLNAAGWRDFGADFDTKVNVLASVTGQGDPLFEFVNDVLSIDKVNAPAILHQLGSNPEEAAALARMNPRQRIAAIVKMTMATEAKPAAAATPARQLSKAPAPAPAIQPATHKTIDWRSPKSDQMTDAEWFKAWEDDERRKARSARL